MIFFSNMQIYDIFVELHWHPAVVNSAEEFEFIQRNQKGLSNTQDFFIGGSSNSTGIISDLSDYLPNRTGNRNVTMICAKLKEGN